ncbi:small nuclear ribonucleoprotein G-like [Marmota marmota marmota]|uniref:small nuclear ribonucleoprotein G-like n=1 Tax=Marmota marmota marmota TaxID=9994 RepID=UPI002091FEED|nr:small nuclear ribonucleoprotein G-like [Marmota marmota marmota]
MDKHQPDDWLTRQSRARAFCWRSGGGAPKIREEKKLNGGRHVQEILLGFDPFMNLVIDALWKWQSVEQNNIEMMATQGNSIVVLEGLEQV